MAEDRYYVVKCEDSYEVRDRLIKDEFKQLDITVANFWFDDHHINSNHPTMGKNIQQHQAYHYCLNLNSIAKIREATQIHLAGESTDLH